MYLNILGLHIHEIRNQCTYIEGNIKILNQSLETEARFGAFLALQGIMNSAMQISRLIWSPRKKGKVRSEELRKLMGIPEKHPLNNSDLQTVFEYCDETNEDGVKNTKGQYILYDFIGDLGKSKHKDVKIENIFRSFDLASKIYVYKGIGFNMDAMLAAIASITDTVNKAHYHLFPDQWTDVDKDGKPTGNKNAPDMKKAPIKEKAKTKKE
jgi:hypothetical protein